MTENEKNTLSRGQTLFCLMSLVAMLITFKYSDIAISAMTVGMKLCVNTVIPSLFPFMVLSELLIASGAAGLAGKYLARPISKLFAISKEGAVALLLGLSCGFPIGTRCAVSLYERGKISRGELEHLCSFCNSPSSAFLISAVGRSFFGSQSFGVMLYVTHIVSSLTIGLIGRAYFAKRKARQEFLIQNVKRRPERDGIASALTGAVTSSASSMLFICAFVIFFSSVVGFLRFFAERADISEGLTALLFGFFEMTSGASSAAALPLRTALPMAAAITGWSGLSVHFQFIGICREHRLSLYPYFLSKIVCSVLNAAIISLLLYFFSDRLSFGASGTVSSLLPFTASPLALVSLALFIGGCLALRVKK